METDFCDEPGWFCDGGPHRAVQNQGSCCTGRPRRTVRYRKRPCGVREVHLSAGAARGSGSNAGRHVERVAGASGSRWRIVVAGAAEVREGEVAAEQMRRKSDAANRSFRRNVGLTARSLSPPACEVANIVFETDKTQSFSA